MEEDWQVNTKTLKVLKTFRVYKVGARGFVEPA
jgi:hypothetical protein